MTLDPALVEAYRRTSFLADVPGGTVCIRVNKMEPVLEQLLENEGATCWAYVTAWNPLSSLLSDQENATRQSELKREIRQTGYKFFTGQGVGDDSSWPPEPSLLILGIPLEEAKELGGKFGQAAIVAGHRGEPAGLVPC